MEKESKKEERKAKGVKALIEGLEDSYGVTKRTLYSILGIFGCLVLTVVMSITGAGFNPEVFATWNYWTGMIIQFAIAIFSMITGEQIGDDTQRNKPDGQFRRELSNYKKQYNRIDEKNIFEYFEDWLETYRERKRAKKTIQTIREFGIKQLEVLDLDITDLDNLKTPWEKDWKGTPFEEKYLNPKTGESKTKFLSLTDEQIEVVKQILAGGIRVSYVSPSYFLNALKGTSVDEWERAHKADKKKGSKLASGYSYRLFMLLVLSLISNGLMAVPYESAGAVFLNIAVRIFVLITSVVWGIYLGFKIVDMDIIFLAFKTYIVKLYCDESEKGTFVPESIEEKAERQLAEYEEEQRKAKEAVVEPEPHEEKPQEESPLLLQTPMIGQPIDS